jgi:hypothetical protein
VLAPSHDPGVGSSKWLELEHLGQCEGHDQSVTDLRGACHSFAILLASLPSYPPWWGEE